MGCIWEHHILIKTIFSVYAVTNLSNGMKYIGMTKNLKSRWNNHANATYYGSKLHEAIRSEGKDNFEFTHLADCFTRKDAELLEKTFIDDMDTKYPNGYNLTGGGYGTAGRPVSPKLMDAMCNRNPMQREDLKQKASERLKGIPNPQKAGELNNFYGVTGENHPSTKYKILATNVITNEQRMLTGIKEVCAAGFNYRTAMRRAKNQKFRKAYNNHTFELVKI